MRYMTNIVAEREIKDESRIPRLLGKATKGRKSKVNETQSGLNIATTA